MKLLESVLRLDSSRLEELAARWHIPIDLKKRLTVAEQVARGLVLVPRWLDRAQLPEQAREALRLLSAAPRGVALDSLPGDLTPLLEQGLVFADPASPERVALPAAFRLQVPASPSDSPRAVRILLQQLSEETRRELCQHHLKRIPPLPWPMLLEPVLEHLEDPEWIKSEIAGLSEAERGLLWAVDALGGEVKGEEVLDLEREPVRIAHGGGVQVPRRSAIFALARRGLVIARPEGWIIPDEVERVVGRERRTRAGIDRQRLLMSRHVQDLTPARAELNPAPGPSAVALMAMLASIEELPAEGRGLSKGSVRKAAQLLHMDPARAELLLCLARAEGLFSASTSIESASERLWTAWRKGGAWDEAAVESDLFRPGHPTTARATALVRDACLDTLLLLPPGEFALTSDVLAVACSDRRVLAAQRFLSLAQRAGQPVLEGVLEVLRVLLEHSTPALGIVDRGSVDAGPVIRLAREARAWLEQPVRVAGRDVPSRPAAAWRTDFRLSCPFTCQVAAVVEAARYGSVWLEDSVIGIEFSEASLARAADHDPDLAGLRAGLSVLSPSVPDALQATLVRAVEQRPMCAFVRVSAFVEIDDPALREAVYRDPEGAELWAAPPLAEGLLVKAGASASKIHALLTRHGARLYSE